MDNNTNININTNDKQSNKIPGNYESIKDTLSFVNNTYDKLSYFDLYGNSVILFIFITLLVFIVFSYCKVMQTKESIADDWTNQRCKPQNMLFAGLITHPENTTAFQYTSDNFQYCVQNILTNISGYALQPFQFMIQALTKVFESIVKSIQKTREVIDKVRNNLKTFTEDVLSRILNIMIPIQKMFISLMDVFQKIQGTMTAGLYTMLGSYYTLQALMGAILELIIKVLVSLVIIIVGLWIMPFTWPAAASMTAVFLAIAIPLAIIIYFMTEVLHIKTSGIPKLRCFDENTIIHLESGNKHIKDVEVGDRLNDGSYITAKIKVTSENMNMYCLNDVIVSESHLINYKYKWIRVGEHPEVTKITYDKEYLYCLNTSNKIIKINGQTFSDWDEIDEQKFYNLCQKNKKIRQLDDIHRILDEGFHGNTLLNGRYIKDYKIGDILSNGSRIYGIVELDAINIDKQKFRNNFVSCNKEDKLYHLLTTDGNLFINGENVKDYNNVIDKFII